jgi:hypothetical protein
LLLGKPSGESQASFRRWVEGRRSRTRRGKFARAGAPDAAKSAPPVKATLRPRPPGVRPALASRRRACPQPRRQFHRSAGNLRFRFPAAFRHGQPRHRKTAEASPAPVNSPSTVSDVIVYQPAPGKFPIRHLNLHEGPSGEWWEQLIRSIN